MLGSTGGYHDGEKRYTYDDDGAGLGSVLKCRCLPLWCRLRRTKLEVLLILLLIGGYVYHQQQEASYIEQLETHEELTESYMQSASEQREKYRECEEAGVLVESQLEDMTKERDEALQNEGDQLAALRQELAAKTEELAATLEATAAEDEAAEAAVAAGQEAFSFANATVAQLEKDLREAQEQNAVLAEQAMKTEQLETVVVGAKAAQEHAEQQVEQLQSELQTVQAELASLKQEADTEKLVTNALEAQLAKTAEEVAEKDEEIASLQHAGEEVEPSHLAANAGDGETLEGGATEGDGASVADKVAGEAGAEAGEDNGAVDEFEADDAGNDADGGTR